MNSSLTMHRKIRDRFSASVLVMVVPWLMLGSIQGQTKHWAYVAPKRPSIPTVNNPNWPRNEIDFFILAKLESENLGPSLAADSRTLAQRVALDLTGMPPQGSAYRRFLESPSPSTYLAMVDSLLASPHYGERMAQDWLDAARYADSNGYQVDRDRELWAWRDWVIQSFNDNLSLDLFTRDQLAGDLLPNPTKAQRIATGFNRNHMINEEGGIIAEEFLAEYTADRVETLGTTWFGLTMNCARCHDHKHDPILQKDFYGLLAFFHNVPENGVGDYGASIRRNTPPFLKLSSQKQETALAKLKQSWSSAENELKQIQTDLLSFESESNWIESVTTPIGWTNVSVISNPTDVSTQATLEPKPLLDLISPMPGQTIYTNMAKVGVRGAGLDPNTKLTAWRLTIHPPVKMDDSGSSLSITNSIMINEVTFRFRESSNSTPAVIRFGPILTEGEAKQSDATKALDSKVETTWTANASETNEISLVLPVLERQSFGSRGTWEVEVVTSAHLTSPWSLSLSFTEAAHNRLLTPEVRQAARKSRTARSEEEQKTVNEFRLAKSWEHSQAETKVKQTKKAFDELDLSIPVTLVMDEMTNSRPTHVLMRGAYDKPGERVFAGTPKFLHPFSDQYPSNRLGLAIWITSPENPLTARVLVNRYWQALFGMGIVRTSEDFGTRGEPPSHPDLLDWLATEFVRTGWDLKSLLRLMVTSATYQQGSQLRDELAKKDPENRLLGRSTRLRLSAEAIRDRALTASGLIVPVIGGPSVRPYHPPGLYEQVVAGSSASTYVQDTGSNLYRRTLYTYWKRSVPNPALLTFDMPFRETCSVRRNRTNTPLQALNLMNDPTYVEAARCLALRMLREGGRQPKSRLSRGFQIALGRPPKVEELRLLELAVDRYKTSFETDLGGAEALIEVGESMPDAAWSRATVAAYTLVATTIMNLDEFISRE